MPDSGKFKDLYLNSAHTYPCQRDEEALGRLRTKGFNLGSSQIERKGPGRRLVEAAGVARG